MAKRGIDLYDDYEPYEREGKTLFRHKHDHISRSHRKFDKCVAGAMAGHHYGSRRAVEKALAHYSRKCAKKYPF